MDDIEDDCPHQPNMAFETMDKTTDTDVKQLNKVIVFSLKLIIIGLSAVYMLYEAIELIKLYHNFDTIISVSYEEKEVNQIPSFTICLPSIIDKSKLLQKYPDLSPKLIEAENDEKRLSIVTHYLDLSLETKNWTQLTIEEEETFNCTLNYWSIKSNRHSIDSKKVKSGLNCREVVKPIESYSNAKTKCFTYFSRLSADKDFIGEYSLEYGVKNLNDLSEIMRIDFSLNTDRYLTLGFIEKQATLSIHDQAVIANDDSDSQHIDPGFQYDITIRKISTKLLEKPYKTSCFDNNKKSKGIDSRKECMDMCVIDLYKEKCKCIPIHLINTLQLLNTSSSTVCSRRDSVLRNDECFERIAEEIGLCLTTDRCPHECHTIRYTYRTKIKKVMTTSEEMNVNVTDDSLTKVLIRIRMDETIGHTFLTHVPLMSFGQLLANICALIVLFSGLSVMGITALMVKSMPTIRLNSAQVKAEDCPTNVKLRAKHWFQQRSQCSADKENAVHRMDRPETEKETVIKRPVTSNVYDTRFIPL